MAKVPFAFWKRPMVSIWFLCFVRETMQNTGPGYSSLWVKKIGFGSPQRKVELQLKNKQTYTPFALQASKQDKVLAVRAHHQEPITISTFIIRTIDWYVSKAEENPHWLYTTQFIVNKDIFFIYFFPAPN